MPFKNLIRSSRNILNQIEFAVFDLIFGKGCPPGLCSLAVQHSFKEPSINASSLPGILQNPFLFAVPKTRRSLEKRRNRKFGWPQYFWKPIVPKSNILLCDNCGHDYEAGHLCGHCYNRVKQETEEVQKAIEKELHLSPIDKEVVVLYEGEASGKPEEFWKGKRIVEMKKPRPSWFSSNLMQKSTADNVQENKNFKPSDLA